MADVFLSYAREDRARAAQIAEGLTAGGYTVFWDVEIPPGVSWADFLQEKLDSCRAALVLWSGASTASSWVREEARLARDRGKLIPVMLDGSNPPFGFGEIQAANLSDWNGEPDNPQWRLLLEGVSRAVGSTPKSTPRAAPLKATSTGWNAAGAAGAGAGAAPSKAEPAPKRHVPWKTIVGSVVGCLVVLVIIGLIWGDGEQGASGDQTSMPPVIEGGSVVNGGPSPADSTSGARSAELPAAVQAIVQQARQAQAAGREAAASGSAAAEKGNQAFLQAQQGVPGFGTLPVDAFTMISGDIGALQQGQPGAVVLVNSQTNTRFSGLMDYDAARGAIRRMTGGGSNGFGGSGLGVIEYNGQETTAAGRDSTAAYTAEGRSQGVVGSFESTGVGVVTFSDGRKYEGQYLVRGQEAHLLRHGMGVTYSARGDVLEAGRYDNDRFAGS